MIGFCRAETTKKRRHQFPGDGVSDYPPADAGGAAGELPAQHIHEGHVVPLEDAEQGGDIPSLGPS